MIRLIIALCIILLLTACGSTKSDRALSGAALGAGGGALVGGLTGGSAVTGALIGGAGGAAAGALTDEDDVNMGKPIWR